MRLAPDYLAFELEPACIRWGAHFRDRETVQTIPLPENYWQILPERTRLWTITKDILSYLRGTEGYLLPKVCTFSAPYLTYRDIAQIENAAQQMGVQYIRALKRISAMALQVLLTEKERHPDDNDHALIVDLNGASCETAILHNDDGILEMRSIVQRQIPIDIPMSVELLRRDVGKAIDVCKTRRISRIYVSHTLPVEYRRMLEQLFCCPCIRMAPDSALRGGMVQGEILTNIRKNVLLLDITDSEILVDQNMLIEACMTIPTSQTLEISYHTARPDRCIDVYIRKNNMTLDVPLHLKLPLEHVLTRGQQMVKLKVTASIDAQEKMEVLIKNAQNGAEIRYGSDDIGRRLRELM